MEKKHLSYYGIGPLYVATISILTLIGILLDVFGVLPRIEVAPLLVTVRIIGILLLPIGIFIWILAVINSKIDKNIRENRLVTTGIYAYVRNPIYSAIMFFEYGVLMIDGNVFLFVLFPIYWVLLTVGVKLTEEKWLLNLYGEEYKVYMKNVNRIMPWFRKKEQK